MATRQRWQSANFIVCFVVMTLLVVVGSLQAMTPAGTRIENRAQATYPWEGELQTSWSNWVTVTVSQVVAVDVTPKSHGTHPTQTGFVPAYDLAVTPEQRVLLSYRILNPGNATDTFNLDVDIYANGGALAASAFEPVLYHDLSGDGLVDLGDPAIDHITISAGESAAVILSLRISPLAMDEEPIFASITATSATDSTVMESNTWSRMTLTAEVPIITANRSLESQRGPMWPPDAPPASGGASGVDAETGDHLTHTITLDNMGYVAGTDIVLWEPLDPSEVLVPDAFGVGFPLEVSGKPTALGANPDAQARLVTDASGRQGIELRLSRIDSTQRVIVKYQVKVDWQPDDDEIAKTAEITYDEAPGKTRHVTSNTLLVLRGQQIALRIIPRGGSLLPGAPNMQHWSEAFAAQSLTFEVTVHNTGRTAAVVELTPGELPLPEGWRIDFFHEDGVTPLTDTNNNGIVDLGYMAVGASRDLVIGVDVPADPELFDEPPYTFPIKAYFASSPELWDTTYLQIDTVTAIDHVWDPLRLVVDPPGVTTPGSVLTYSLYFANASSVDAYNVAISVRLSGYLEPPTNTGGEVIPADEIAPLLTSFQGQDLISPAADPVTGVYDPAQHAIVWTIPHVPSSTGGVLTFVAHVGAWTPKSAVIEVQGILSSAETTLVAVSNVVTNVALTDQLLVTIDADDHVLALGDATTVTVEVQNPNPIQALDDVEVHVILPPGMSYREGTSRLGTASIPDPVQYPGYMVYTVPRIDEGSRVRLTFDTIVNPAADYELVVSAVAMMETGPDEWGMSPKASLHLYVIKGVLSDSGVIVGRVLLSGRELNLAEDTSRGVPGVRVVLDNGQFAISDMDGRFSFPEVEAGTRLLRLDPFTLETVELVPGGIDPGQSKTRRAIVPVGGIAMVDFVLNPPEFEVVSFEQIIEEGNE